MHSHVLLSLDLLIRLHWRRSNHLMLGLSWRNWLLILLLNDRLLGLSWVKSLELLVLRLVLRQGWKFWHWGLLWSLSSSKLLCFSWLRTKSCPSSNRSRLLRLLFVALVLN